MNHLYQLESRRRLLSCFITLLLLAGCSTVQYVSRYDAETEAQINKIQRQVESLFGQIERTLGTPEADFENFAAAYSQLHQEANILNTRAQAIDKNRITIEQSEQLIEWLKGLELVHQLGIADEEVLSVPRTQAQQIFVAMLKFELAKKRQLDPAIIGEE